MNSYIPPNTPAILLLGWLVACVGQFENVNGQTLKPVRVSVTGKSFVQKNTTQTVKIWGVNYDHDRSGRLLDEYWGKEWPTVESDFQEIKELGANCVRIHLQLGKFMKTPTETNSDALANLKRVLKLANRKGLYLDITGLACYHKANIPEWFNRLSEQERWNCQAMFWESVAKVCRGNPAVFCYDLMNEPILPGKKKPSKEWLGGELGGKFFVQRLALDLKGRQRNEVAEAWVKKMVGAIRKHDPETLVTVGVIPWALVFPKSKPVFYSPKIAKHLDFVSVHFYPRKNEVDKAIQALKVYEIGKPLVVEECFPLKCSQKELVDFMQKSKSVDGWVSFYWGQTAKQLRDKKKPSIGDHMMANWLDEFQKQGREFLKDK